MRHLGVAAFMAALVLLRNPLILISKLLRLGWL